MNYNNRKVFRCKLTKLCFTCETRPYGKDSPNRKIYIMIMNKQNYENFEDDHDHIYVIRSKKFHKEFTKLPFVKGEYNNEYTPINFDTEEKCIEFLKSLGISEV